MKARRGDALSGWSNYVRVDLPEEEQPTPTPTPTPAPETDPVDLAPSSLAAGVVDNGVSLTWDAPSEDADTVTGYQVLRRDLGDQEQDKVTPLADTGGAGTAYVDTTVQAGDRYIYRVKAYRGTETSRWSNQANVTLPDDYGSDGTSSDEPEPTPTPTPTPEPERQTAPADLAPTNLGVTLATDGGLHLDWDAPAEEAADVTGYAISRSVGSGSLAVLVADTESTDTGYTDAAATTPGETYAYQVKAIRNGTESQGSNLAVMQLPDPAAQAPSNLTAELVDGGVSLDWDAPAEEADNVTGYAISRSVGSGSLAVLVSDTESTDTGYTDAAATTPGETYGYQVKAIRNGTESQGSNLAVMQLPDPAAQAPSNLTAELVDGGVSLDWDAPAEEAADVTGYAISRSVGSGSLAVLVADTESTDTGYTDAAATTPGETYAYQVKAIRNGTESQGSNSAVMQLPDPADLAPANLGVTLATDGGLHLDWDAPAEEAADVTGYAISRSVGSGSLAVLVSDTESTDTDYTDAAATTPGETYGYQVKAIRNGTESQGSNLAVMQLPDPAAQAPSNLTAELVDGGVSLDWDAPAEEAADVTGYAISRSVGSGSLAVLVADTESTDTGYTDAAATTPGETYAYQVKAIRNGTESQGSNSAVMQLPDPADLAPANLGVTLATDGGLHLDWDAPAEEAADVTGYAISRSVGSGSLAVLVADTESTDTGYTDAAATTPGETYAYQVKAIRNGTESQGSNSAVMQLPDPADLAPANLGVTLATDGGLHLDWDAPAEEAADVTGYAISRSVGSGSLAVLVADTESTDTGYTDAAATTPGETYAYQVKAIRNGTESQGSNSAAMQLPDPADLAPANLGVTLATDGGVSLDWDAPAEDSASVTGYRILRAAGAGEPAVLVSDTATTGTSYTDATATTPGETYTYAVKALRGADESVQSGSASVEVPDPARLAPSNLTGELTGEGVQLSWDAPAEDAASVTDYLIVRILVPYDPAAIDQASLEEILTGSTETRWLDTGESGPGRWKHSHAVRAVRGEEKSGLSNTFDIDVENPVEDEGDAESDLVRRVLADLWSAELTVADLGYGHLGYDDGSSRFGSQAGDILGDLDPVDLELDGYQLTAKALYVYDYNGHRLVLRVTTGLWKEDRDLKGLALGGHEHRYVLTLGGSEYDMADASPRHSMTIASGGIYTGYVSYIWEITDPGWVQGDTVAVSLQKVREFDRAFLAPTGLTATVEHVAEAPVGGVTLSWNAPAEEAEQVTGYVVYRAVNGGELAVLVADTQSTLLSYYDGTASTAGETYSYGVAALRDTEESPPSDRLDVVAEVAPALLAPTGLSASPVFDIGDENSLAGVALSWQPPVADSASVTAYQIRRKSRYGTSYEVLAADTGSSETLYTDETATGAGDFYTYRVYALRDANRSQDPAEAAILLPGSDHADLVQFAPVEQQTELFSGTMTVANVYPGSIFGSAHGYRREYTQTQEQIDSTREHVEILRRDGWDDVNVRRVERSYSTAYDGAMSPNSFTWDGLTHDIATLAVTSEDELWLHLHVGKGSGRICAAPDGCFVPYRYKLVVDGKEFHSRDAKTSRIDHFSIRGRCELGADGSNIRLGGYGYYIDCSVWVAGPYEYRGWDADGLSLTAGDSVTVKILGLPTPEVRGMSFTGGQGASRTVRASVFTPQNAKLYVRYREFAPYTKDWVELTPINLGSGTTSQDINLTGLQPGITYQVQASFASNFDLPEPIRAREFIKFETG